MQYITIAEAAEMWMVSQHRVREWAREGRIPGAYRSSDANASWQIPATAQRPPQLPPGAPSKIKKAP
jgi:hypothetical protein